MAKQVNIGLIGYAFMGRAHSFGYLNARLFYDCECKPVMKAICGRSEDAVKVEPSGWGDHPNEIVGRDKLADHEEWLTEDWLTINSVSIAEGPFIGADGFAVVIKSDFTFKESGERHIFREVGRFTVVDGQIVREEYLYDEAEMDMLRRMNEQHAAKGAGT